MSLTPSGSVEETGAVDDDVLLGVMTRVNDGLAVEVFSPQSEGHGGRIQGAFKVLSPGGGCYAQGIASVLQNQPRRVFQNVASFLLKLQKMPGCEKATHILNANSLRRADPAEAKAARALEQRLK